MANKVLFEIDVDANITDLVKLQTEIDKLEKNQKELNKNGQKNTKTYQQNSVALKGLKKELNATQKGLIDNQRAQKANAGSLKQLRSQLSVDNQRAQKANAGSLKQLRSQLSVVSAEWAKLSKHERENTQRGKLLTKQKRDLTAQLKQLEKATGDSRRNVGNYGSALGGLGKSFVGAALGAAGLVGGD
jgi:chromosome segregation ATPase